MTEGTVHNVHITLWFSHNAYFSSVPNRYFLKMFH